MPAAPRFFLRFWRAASQGSAKRRALRDSENATGGRDTVGFLRLPAAFSVPSAHFSIFVRGKDLCANRTARSGNAWHAPQKARRAPAGGNAPGRCLAPPSPMQATCRPAFRQEQRPGSGVVHKRDGVPQLRRSRRPRGHPARSPKTARPPLGRFGRRFASKNAGHGACGWQIVSIPRAFGGGSKFAVAFFPSISVAWKTES